MHYWQGEGANSHQLVPYLPTLTDQDLQGQEYLMGPIPGNFQMGCYLCHQQHPPSRCLTPHWLCGSSFSPDQCQAPEGHPLYYVNGGCDFLGKIHELWGAPITIWEGKPIHFTKLGRMPREHAQDEDVTKPDPRSKGPRHPWGFPLGTAYKSPVAGPIPNFIPRHTWPPHPTPEPVTPSTGYYPSEEEDSARTITPRNRRTQPKKTGRNRK